MIRILIMVLVLAGGWQMGSGSWIWAKAQLAQWLLEQSWHSMKIQDSSSQPNPVKPWPWADTYATARLRVPSLAEDMIVLQGDSGRTLAFGPGHSADSAQPGRPGTTVFSGHRDTHFDFIRDLKQGMKIEVETLNQSIQYRVRAMQVIDSRLGGVSTPEEGHGLLLVTCYPFDSIEVGGPLRYLVWAEVEHHQPGRHSTVLEKEIRPKPGIVL
ncbi:MAG: class GN sortase [Motiliproteus sp.]|nr:class GN sortase [Motiliproteus sp.]MCW9051667.1 class GN sortase [Motiliproteus sp.]